MDLRERLSIAIDKITIFRDIRDDLRADGKEFIAPLGLDGAGELDKVQMFAEESADRFSQGLDGCPAGIEVAGMEGDDIVVIAQFDAGMVEQLGGQVGGLVKFITAVITDQSTATRFDLTGQGRIADLNFVGLLAAVF